MRSQTILILKNIQYHHGWFREYFLQTTLRYNEVIIFFHKRHNDFILLFILSIYNVLFFIMTLDNKEVRFNRNLKTMATSNQLIEKTNNKNVSF